MSVTIHVNGAANSLVHKGSTGVAIATIPDVCKTPSPGGPVPIPYPNIAISSSLAKGTKTVKVDGKQMAAVKGSEFSRSNGDEAGVAGGVKSSTNMKEATWILYSFDVKLEGKNACRLADKMQMNHGNTVCLGGEMQAPVASGVIKLKCKDEWDDCQKKQMCTKVASLNKSTPLKKQPVTPAIKAAKKKYQAQYREENPIPGGSWTDDCAKTNGKPADADHVTDVQWGGDVKGPFEYLDMSVNRSIGKQMDLSNVDPVGSFATDPNCGC